MCCSFIRTSRPRVTARQAGRVWFFNRGHKQSPIMYQKPLQHPTFTHSIHQRRSSSHPTTNSSRSAHFRTNGAAQHKRRADRTVSSRVPGSIQRRLPGRVGISETEVGLVLFCPACICPCCSPTSARQTSAAALGTERTPHQALDPCMHGLQVHMGPRAQHVSHQPAARPGPSSSSFGQRPADARPGQGAAVLPVRCVFVCGGGAGACLTLGCCTCALSPSLPWRTLHGPSCSVCKAHNSSACEHSTTKKRVQQQCMQPTNTLPPLLSCCTAVCSGSVQVGQVPGCAQDTCLAAAGVHRRKACSAAALVL